jgi:hypothetical protein
VGAARLAGAEWPAGQQTIRNPFLQDNPAVIIAMSVQLRGVVGAETHHPPRAAVSAPPASLPSHLLPAWPFLPRVVLRVKQNPSTAPASHYGCCCIYSVQCAAQASRSGREARGEEWRAEEPGRHSITGQGRVNKVTPGGGGTAA